MVYLSFLFLSVIFNTQPPALEPTEVQRFECIHIWAVPEFNAVVWTFGLDVDWYYGTKAKRSWEDENTSHEITLLCRRCKCEAWSCSESNFIWPEKWEWPRPFGGAWYKTYCRDAIWLGQVRETKWQSQLLRNSRPDR